jgi:diguanylate cyclase (GGDEF)-like protein
MAGSWLCRDDIDRERLVEMERHLRPVRAITIVIIVAATFGSVGWVGFGTLAVVGVAAVLAVGLFHYADSRVEKSGRPEYIVFAAWVGAQVVIAGCILLTGGPDSPGIPWIAIPVVTLSARFSLRGVLLGVAITLVLLLASTLAVDPAPVLNEATLVVTPAVVIVCVAILSTALMRSDLHYRSEAVIDPLTGMLNRKALSNRASELSEQAAITGASVGLIVGDLDRFKLINDSLGHATGDAVLKEVAYRLRKRLRAFDLAYRIGGEEFLVLVPGAGLEPSCALAEELREAVASGNFAGGVEVTMSFGVSASEKGRFDYEEVFAAADEALYEAKRAGANRVCTEPGAALVHPPGQERVAAQGAIA